jgi:LuxR family maltose regulon positive regulatory protein
MRRTDFTFQTPVPDLRPTEALKAQIWVRQGRLPEAWAWARDRGLSAADDLNYLHEFEHLTLARLFIVQHKHDETGSSIDHALELLERLMQAAEAGGRIGSMIEILIKEIITLNHHI